MRLFLIAAIVLIVLAILATASATGTCLGVTALTWIAAALLAYFVDLLWPWALAVPRRSPNTAPPAS